MPKAVVTDPFAPSSVKWPDHVEGPWQVTLTWRAREDRADCVGLTVEALNLDDTEPLTATLMRSVPLGRIMAAARWERFAANYGQVVNEPDLVEELEFSAADAQRLHARSQPWAERPSGRRPELNHEHYRDVAKAYSQAHAAGLPPLRAVEQRFFVSRPTASRWVAAARAADLLPPTEKGRAMGNAALVTESQPDQEPGR